MLSGEALALFRRHVERPGDVAVDDETRPVYRELARAGFLAAPILTRRSRKPELCRRISRRDAKGRRDAKTTDSRSWISKARRPSPLLKARTSAAHLLCVSAALCVSA